MENTTILDIFPNESLGNNFGKKKKEHNAMKALLPIRLAHLNRLEKIAFRHIELQVHEQ
jgi:hypothetical protein